MHCAFSVFSVFSVSVRAPDRTQLTSFCHFARKSFFFRKILDNFKKRDNLLKDR